MLSNSLLGPDALLRAIDHTPIIDHHAHPLMTPSAISRFPLLSIASEAHDDLPSSRSSLAHLRAVRQLSAALGCDPEWDAVERAIGEMRAEDRREEWTKRCLAGIQCLLVDDGLGEQGPTTGTGAGAGPGAGGNGVGDMEPFNALDGLTPDASRRIVRIERIAEMLIPRHCGRKITSGEAFEAVCGAFEAEIGRAVRDPRVAGFKSVVCYRTGLAVPAKPDAARAKAVFAELYDQLALEVATEGETPVRLDHPGLNEHFVHLAAEIISRGSGGSEHRKPFQFHTGLGDNDIILANASPALLQPLVRAYPSVPFVLLHSGYPFVRETGYLASAAPNVYADIGEIFPVISREGQESALRRILEVCPSSKILWSTDGHHVPETYFLAVAQVRQALRAVLTDYVAKGDLSCPQAIQLVQDLLFQNANRLYGLGLTMKETLKGPVSGPSALVPVQGGSLRLLTEYLGGKEGAPPKFLDIWWNDAMSAGRMRTIPMRRILSMLSAGEDLSFGLATAYSGLLLNETLVGGASAIGEHRLTPDLTTLRPGFRDGHVLVNSNLREQDGSAAALCPRSTLQRVLSEAAGHGLTFDLGFEVELCFVRRVNGQHGCSYESLSYPGHNASNVRAFEHKAIAELIEEAIEKLDKAGIVIDMVHAESAPGQYEIILPRASALAAVDNLVYARDVISSCAASREMRVTLHPKPFPMSCGTASHCHMSISSPGGNTPAVYEPFYAGILKHLRAIVAFTYSSIVSYERAQDGCWAGGTWVTYGTMNREAPLRKVHQSHWEMKCMDGLANPYLALAAVLTAGTHGVVDKEPLTWKDCTVDPSQLTEKARESLCIKERIPRSLGEAITALKADEDLDKWMGELLVERYIAVKESEDVLLGAMGPEERRLWIMDRF